MIDFYNAFISYKHAPLDSKVAEHVQRTLEHYHIPSSIAKQTGKKKIERIFRDKDELPITSDLTDTISNALEKADFLIVICSPRTKESVWVDREIDFFLKTHDRSRVLTVLAEGEPVDVIPERLLYVEKEVTEYNGFTHKVKTPVEPLSCDYRMPFSRAKKEELPRLAAALIGCSYDELVRRQRVYKMRQIIIVSALLISAAALFSIYMFNSKQAVDEAYNNSLISQSRYLATESQNLMDDNLRLDALHLALAAMPQDEDDPRPVTGEAVAALTRATHSYRTLAGISIDSLWNYSTGSQIMQFKLNESGTRLAALDEVGIVTVWDTESHIKLFDISNSDYYYQSLIFAGDDLLILVGINDVNAYDATTGDNKWTLYLDDYTYFDFTDPVVLDHDRMIFPTTDPKIYIVDVDSGEIEREIDMGSILDSSDCTISQYSISPDNSMLGMSLYYGIDDNAVAILNLNNENINVSAPIEESISSIEWADDNHFIVGSFSLSYEESSRLNDTYILAPNHDTITCYDPRTLNVVWTGDLASSSLNLNTGIINLSPMNMVGFYSGNCMNAYDIETGEVLYEWNANETIIDVSDRDNNGWPMIITNAGAMITPMSNRNDALTMTREFTDNIDQLTVNHGVYLVRENGRDIIYYNTYVSDDQYVPVDGITTGTVFDSYLDDEVLATLSYSDSYSIKLYLTDPDEGELIGEVELPFDNYYSTDLSFLGAEDGYLYMIFVDYDDGTYLVKIDIDDCSCTSALLSDVASNASSTASCQNGMIAYLSGSRSSYSIAIRELGASRDEAEIAVPVDNAYDLLLAPVYYDDLGVAYVSTSDGDYLINVGNESYTHMDLPASWSGTSNIIEDSLHERLIISDGRQILFINPGTGDIEMTISSGGMMPLGYTFIRDEERELNVLAVAYSQGILIRYDAETGEYIGSSDMSTYANYTPTAEFTVDYETGTIYIQQERLLNVIDLDSWVETICIDNCLGHHMRSDRFYATSYMNDGEVNVGYFRHYTAEELIARAREIIGNNSMPDDLRGAYGL